MVLGQGCLGGDAPQSSRPSSNFGHVSHYPGGKKSKGMREGERDQRGSYMSVTSLSCMVETGDGERELSGEQRFGTL